MTMLYCWRFIGLFVGMVSFTLHTVVPLERLIGAQWARSVGLTADLGAAVNIECKSPLLTITVPILSWKYQMYDMIGGMVIL
jgi:hypothetical protein